MRRYLAGKEPLWKAFWIFTIGGLIAIGIFGYGIYLVGYAVRVPTAQISLIAGMLLLIPYQVLCLIAIWRSSPNTDWEGWTILARVGVVMFIASYIVGIFQA